MTLIMTQQEAEALMKNALLMLKKAEHLFEEAAKLSAQNAQSMAQAVNMLDSKINQTVNNFEKVLVQNSERALKAAVETQVTSFEEQLANAAANVEKGSQRLDRQSARISQQAKFLTWKSLTTTAFGCVLAFAALTWYAWKTRQEMSEIALSTERQQALKNMTIATCKEKVCVKIQLGDERFGEQGDFAIIADK